MGCEQCECRKQSETGCGSTELEGQSREPRQGPGPGREASSGDLVVGGGERWALEVKGMTIRLG